MSELAQAAVAVSVFAVILFGMLLFHVRQQAIAESPAASSPAAISGGSYVSPALLGRETRRPRPSPTPLPTPPPTPAPVLPAAAARLDPGDWAVINADGVRIRTQPSTDAPSEVIGRYSAGAYIQVLDGPEMGSGYYWFLVEGEGPTGWVAAGTAAGSWVIGTDAPSVLVSIPGGNVTVRGAQIKYFDIVGSSPSELRYAIGVYGPETSGGDVIATAEMVPEFTPVYRTETTPFGTVSYPTCHVSWTFTVTVPLWIGPSPAPQPLVVWWVSTLDRIRDHEATHVRIWREALPDLRARLDPTAEDPYCDRAYAAVQAWLTIVSVQQDAFDAEHGVLDWPAAPGLN